MLKKGILAFLLWIFVVGGIGALLIYYYNYSPNNQVVPAFEEGRMTVVVGGEIVVSANEPKIMSQEILLPFDTVKKYIDKDIYWDEALNKLTVTTKDRVVRMNTDNLTAMINNKPKELKISVIKDKNVIYVPVEFLKDLYNIEIEHVKSSNVVIIDNKKSIKKIGEVISKSVIRNGHSVHHPIIRKLNFTEEEKGSQDYLLRVFDQYEDWYKVRTWDGAIGFIHKKHMNVKDYPVNDNKLEEKTPEWKPEKGKINLVWDMVYTPRENPYSVEKMKGLDVISPTWFQLKDSKGELINRAYSSYVKWAHESGYKVWALLSNDFGDYEMTSQFLNNTDSRDKLIENILVYSALYKLDGINIDFENLYDRDRDAFTQFVREITPFLKEQGLVVSVDVNDIACYDKKALSEVVDYIMYMSYDQHWSTSPVAGSVAQFSWVERILKRVLEEEGIPKEKLLLGLPFYSRLWQEETGENGEIKLSSKALSMEDAKKVIVENKAEVVWEEESGQFYATYKKQNSVFKLWLEDVNSINLKSSLVLKYNLAGVCSWSRNFVSSDIWTVLNNNLKDINSYDKWLNFNKDKKYEF